MAEGSHGRAQRSALVTRIAELAASAGVHIAVAESLTGGMLSSALAEAPAASSWFRGAVVAYASDVKHRVLGVPPGPVVSAQAAAAMAGGVRELLDADVAVALTGAAGPDGQDGWPAGTVFLALAAGGPTQVEHRHWDRDDPAEVCAQAVLQALRMLHAYLHATSTARATRQ
jgi:nicotinamide-nucleotide amidase